MRLINIILFTLIAIFLLQVCSVGTDKTVKLSAGYYYRDEGGNIKDILCENPDGGEIPSEVVDFDYNQNFIIAKQKPKIPQDPLYSRTYVYENGIIQYYYWIIIHEKRLVLGPLSEDEFKLHIKEYSIPLNFE